MQGGHDHQAGHTGVRWAVAITDVLAARVHGDGDVEGPGEVLGVRDDRADIREAGLCRTLPHQVDGVSVAIEENKGAARQQRSQRQAKVAAAAAEVHDLQRVVAHQRVEDHAERFDLLALALSTLDADLPTGYGVHRGMDGTPVYALA